MRNYSGTDRRDPDAIHKIDYFLRDVSAAMQRITASEIPTGGGGVTGGAIGVTDHGALSGLADDDHAQYAFLAGRTTQQALSGGLSTNSANSLVLRASTTPTVLGLESSITLQDYETDFGKSKAVLKTAMVDFDYPVAVPAHDFRITLANGTGSALVANGRGSFSGLGSSIALQAGISGTIPIDSVPLKAVGSTGATVDLFQVYLAGVKKIWVDKDGILCGVGSTLGYVTLDTAQTITGKKSFPSDGTNCPVFHSDTGSPHSPAFDIINTEEGVNPITLSVQAAAIPGFCQLMPGIVFTDTYPIATANKYTATLTTPITSGSPVVITSAAGFYQLIGDIMTTGDGTRLGMAVQVFFNDGTGVVTIPLTPQVDCATADRATSGTPVYLASGTFSVYTSVATAGTGTFTVRFRANYLGT